MDLGLSVNEFSTRHPTFANPQTWGTRLHLLRSTVRQNA